MEQLWTVVAESDCKPVNDVIRTHPMSRDSELKKKKDGYGSQEYAISTQGGESGLWQAQVTTRKRLRVYILTPRSDSLATLLQLQYINWQTSYENRKSCQLKGVTLFKNGILLSSLHRNFGSQLRE